MLLHLLLHLLLHQLLEIGIDLLGLQRLTKQGLVIRLAGHQSAVCSLGPLILFFLLAQRLELYLILYLLLDRSYLIGRCLARLHGGNPFEPFLLGCVVRGW